MTDTKALADAIEQSGKKKGYLAECLGITRAGFHKKEVGENSFTAPEVGILKSELDLTLKQVDRIFLQ